MACSVAVAPANSASTAMYKESLVIASPCLLPRDRSRYIAISFARGIEFFKSGLQGLFLPDEKSVRHPSVELVSAESPARHFAVICMSTASQPERKAAQQQRSKG